MSDKDGLNLPESITDIGSYLDGIPLPPAIKKSLWKSLGHLITGLVDVPVAYLEAKSQKIRSQADALSLVTKKASEAAATKFGQDERLIERTVNYFGQKLLNEQINRETIVAKAIEELKADPPKEDSNKEIETDWLEMFARIAEQKSNADIQLFLSKILAGEIRRPGSFSPQSINLLSLLNQDTALLFQKFCDISFSFMNMKDMTCMVYEPFGNPGTNSLAPVGFQYSNLTKLQDAGLIQHDLNAWKEVSKIIFSSGFAIGGKTYPRTQVVQPTEGLLKVGVINFTNSGLEIRSVLHLATNPTYEQKFLEWLKGSHNLDLSK